MLVGCDELLQPLRRGLPLGKARTVLQEEDGCVVHGLVVHLLPAREDNRHSASPLAHLPRSHTTAAQTHSLAPTPPLPACRVYDKYSALSFSLIIPRKRAGRVQRPAFLSKGTGSHTFREEALMLQSHVALYQHVHRDIAVPAEGGSSC